MVRKMNYPRLEQGSKLGIISPSSGLAGLFPHRIERGIKLLEKQGFQVVLGKNALKKGQISGKPEERAEDLNNFINDDEIKGILTTIGGDYSIQLLELVDFEGMKKSPKIFMGFSDITVLHLAFLKNSKVSTFYGPSLLSNFGEVNPLEFTLKSFIESTKRKSIDLHNVVEYTDEFIDWSEDKPKTIFKKTKLTVLREGVAKGNLIGGCLPSILRTAGTTVFPNFKKGIVFLELPEGNLPSDSYSLSETDADISQLIEMGFFENCKGLLFGIPYRYSDSLKKQFHSLILERLKEFDFPIIAELNFGHTDPIYTLPYWHKTKIKSTDSDAVIHIDGLD